ncbi:MAG: Stp1/IreP family PP2C-type Ser/Thr phosphatase [Clostridiales bacterium]|nr:Stp1/IreP family PP2C-type Ser/Thr phosphatase [Clostridiales bacterium]
MKACALTDRGIYRSENQDFVYASTENVGSLENLFILADGMGGHQAGDYASRYAVEHLVSFFEKKFPLKDVHGILKDGVKAVNRELYDLANEKPELAGMGSTLVIATIRGNVLYIANIGDSRLYLLRDELEQVTRDHSYVEELVAMGMMKRGSRDYQEKKNYITRALGVERTVDADLYALKCKAGDRILMCSDGLSNMVDEFEMEYIIRTEETLEKQAGGLVDAANRNGGKDNISVILIEPQISEVQS